MVVKGPFGVHARRTWPGALLSCALLSCALLSGALLSCALQGDGHDDDERDAFLRQVLVDDARDLLLRDPDQVAAQWARMAQDPFSYLRGSARVFVRDVVDSGGAGHLPSTFGDGLTSSVWLVADAHPENVGTFLPRDGVQTLDFNDFDVARFGPFELDVRRLALGFSLAVQAEQPDEAVATQALSDRLAAAVADGYVDGVRTPSWRVTPASAPGVIAADLFRRARDDGLGHDELAATTGADDGSRMLVRTRALDAAILDADSEQTFDVEPTLRGPLIDAVQRAVADVRPGRRVLDVVRVSGRGVGSRPLLRFLALLDDDVLLEIKEARDALRIDGLALVPGRFFVDNASRIVASEDALQSVDDGNDPSRVRIALAPLSFVAHGESGWRKTFRVARLRDDLRDATVSPDDAIAFARLCGRMLGAAHARAPGVDGNARDIALQAALPDSRRDAFVQEIVAFAQAMRVVTVDDTSRLAAMLVRHGPLLGWAR